MESNSLNAKHFKFNDKVDYIFYLAELITDLIQKKDRLERYGNEIQSILKNNPNAKIIQSEIYETISDKVNRVFQYLFNLIGDESKKAVSYRKYRKILFKARNNLKISISQLTQGEAEILGEFNQLRNWGLHIPESLFLQKKAFFKIDSKFILTNKKVIPIPTYDYFEIKFLKEIGREVKEVLNASNLILERMKDDYSKLYSPFPAIKVTNDTFQILLFNDFSKPKVVYSAPFEEDKIGFEEIKTLFVEIFHNGLQNKINSVYGKDN